MQPQRQSLFSLIGMTPNAGSLPSKCSCHNLSGITSRLIKALPTALPFSVVSPVKIN